MRKWFGLLIFGFAFLIQVEGQAPPPPSPRQGPPAPPPAPLIYSPPLNTDIKEFTPESKLFTARFPGMPSEQKRMSNGADITTYRVYRKGSNSTIAITEKVARLADHSEEGFRLIREAIRKQGGKIENDSEVAVNGWKGREFRALHDYTFRRFRVFIVGARVFEIQSDVTNWHIIGDKVKKEWNKETDRFFASFKLN